MNFPASAEESIHAGTNYCMSAQLCRILMCESSTYRVIYALHWGTHVVFHSGRHKNSYHVSLGSDWYMDSSISGNKFHFLILFFFPSFLLEIYSLVLCLMTHHLVSHLQHKSPNSTDVPKITLGTQQYPGQLTHFRRKLFPSGKTPQDSLIRDKKDL